MRIHTFALILENPSDLTSQLEDAVHEAGCGDAAHGMRSGVVYLEFDREADSFLEAVMTAIRDVSSIPDAVVARLEPDELVTASDIADRIGRTRESIRLLIEGARGPGGFPVPVSGSSARRIRLWRWTQVAEWLDEHGFTADRRDEARIIAAINGALDLIRNADNGTGEEILEAVRRAHADRVLPH
jgi:hypothetical protein